MAILEGFGEVDFRDGFGVFEIGNCAGDFEGFEVGTCGEIKALGGIIEKLLDWGVERTEPDGFDGAERGIKFTASVKLFIQSLLDERFGSLVLGSARCCIFY